MSDNVKRIIKRYTKEYKLIAIKTENGKLKGEIAFYCRVLKISRQGFYSYLESLEKPWKYEALAAKITESAMVIKMRMTAVW